MLKTDIAILLFLLAIPLISLIVFVQPNNFQEALITKSNDLNPLTFFTSVFVHADLGHLLGNLLIFLIFGFALYFVCKIADKEKSYLYSLILLVTLVPLLFNAIFAIMASLIFQVNVNAFGLSLVVAGCMGLVIPSLRALLKSELENARISSHFSFGLFLLTCSFVMYSYTSSLSNLIVFVALTICGSLFSFFAFFKLARNIPKEDNKKEKRNLLLTVLILFLYFVFLGSLFPANIISSQGSVVNIFAHYFGLFVGLSFAFLIFQYKK